MRRMQAPGMAYEDEAACLFMSPDATVPLPLDLGANFISGWVCGKRVRSIHLSGKEYPPLG